MKPIAQDELSLSDQLKLDLKEAQKEERLASAKSKAILRQYNQARQDEGAEPKPSISVNETKGVLMNIAEDTSLTSLDHLQAIADVKLKPDNWPSEVLDNKPYGINEAHKQASKESKGIKKAKTNGKLKGASLRGITSSSSLKVALDEYRQQLTDSERIDEHDLLLIKLLRDNEQLKTMVSNIDQNLTNTEKLVLEVTQSSNDKEQCHTLFSKGISAYKTSQLITTTSYPTIKRWKNKWDNEPK